MGEHEGVSTVRRSMQEHDHSQNILYRLGQLPETESTLGDVKSQMVYLSRGMRYNRASATANMAT